MTSKNELFIKCNIRKSKKQVVSVCVLIVLSAMLLNIILILFGDFKDNFSRKREELNCSTVDYVYVGIFSSDLSGKISEILDMEEDVKSYEIDKNAGGFGTLEFGGGILSNITSVTSMSDAQNKTVNRYEIVSKSDGEGVYLGYIFHSGGGFDVGDEVKVNLNGREYFWRVAGFYNSLGTGSANCIDITCILTDGLYETVCEENPSIYKVSVNLNDGVDASQYLNGLNDRLTSKILGLLYLDSQISDEVYSCRYTNATVFEAILSASTVVMLAVMVFVVAVCLNNYVNNSISNYGAFKAMGYGSGAMILPLVLEFSALALFSSAAGIALSYLVMKPINSALESQIGIPYDVHFIPGAALVTLVLAVVIVSLTTYLSVRKIRKIPAISAIRQNKKRDAGVKAVDLSKTKISVNTALGLKNCLGNISHGVIVLVSVIGVSFLSGFSIYLSQNILGNADDVLSLICGQTPDSTVRITASQEKELVNAFENDGDIKDFYLYSVKALTPSGYSHINAYIVETTEYVNPDTVLSGELPKNAEQIAVNKKYALKNGLEIGDVFEVEGKEFTVCGLIQGAYYSGEDCYILREGFEEIGEISDLCYYVDLNDGVDIDAFNERITASLHPTLVVNQKSYLSSLSNMYSTILRVLVVIIIALSVMIISFILYVILSILLENKRREHGILKSLGYVSREIIYQTVVSVLPYCILGTAVGLILSGTLSNELVVINLTGMGIFRFGSMPNPVYLLLCGVVLIAFVIIYTVILSRSVKKIAPHDLFNRE